MVCILGAVCVLNAVVKCLQGWRAIDAIKPWLTSLLAVYDDD